MLGVGRIWRNGNFKNKVNGSSGSDSGSRNCNGKVRRGWDG